MINFAHNFQQEVRCRVLYPASMLSIIKAIIFDLDGVITFTDEYHYLAWKAVAGRIGVPFDREINNRLRGVSRMESLDIILTGSNTDYTDEEKLRLATEKNDIYCGYLEQMSDNDLSNETRQTLFELRDMGLKLAIGSSSRNAKTILRKIGLESFFDAVSDGTNISRTKPDPEVFLCAAGFLNEKPERCVVVEDAVPGIEAGNAAGMRTIAMGDAVNSPLATWNIDSFSQITAIINKAEGRAVQ